jgi:hypothetical protein
MFTLVITYVDGTQFIGEFETINAAILAAALQLSPGDKWTVKDSSGRKVAGS